MIFLTFTFWGVVNLQNTVTNPISDGMRFYRLKK